jgi:flagellar basal body rod protein FlgC
VNLSPLSGMRAADLLLTATTDRVARAPDPGVDLAEEMTNLVVARTAYTANARVLRVGLENERTLLDVFA